MYNMSGNVSDTAVIVIVIVGAGAVVLLGYAIHAAFTRGRVNPSEAAHQRNDEQDGYMRQLREKNYTVIEQETRRPRRPMPAYPNNTRMSKDGPSSPEY